MPNCAACCSAASLLGKLGHLVLPSGKHAQAGGHTGLLSKGFAGQMPLDGATSALRPLAWQKWPLLAIGRGRLMTRDGSGLAEKAGGILSQQRVLFSCTRPRGPTSQRRWEGGQPRLGRMGGWLQREPGPHCGVRGPP